MSATAPWESDHEFDAQRALVVIKDVFTHLDVSEVVAVGEGWDFRVFVVNKKWIFRFPKRRNVVKTLRMERRLLPLLESAVPVAVPRYLFVGQPHRLFPYEFAGYEFLPGMSIARIPHHSSDMKCIARQAGAFLASLHSIPAQYLEPIRDMLDRVIPNDERIRQKAASAVSASRDALSSRTFEAMSAHIAQWKPASESLGPLVLAHRDFRPEHIMCDRRDLLLTGIIDWSDASFTVPWTDFLWLWIFYGDGFIREALTEYDKSCTSTGYLGSIRGFGIFKALNELAYGIESKDSVKADLARRALERAFGE